MLGDCPKCWDGLCSCGYMFKDWSPHSLVKLVARLDRLIALKQNKEQHILDDDNALMKELDNA